MYRDLFTFRFLKDNKKIIYFDAACTYIKFKKTLEGINRYYTEYSCCSGDRTASLLGGQLLEEIQLARKNILEFINASSEDYAIFCKSTTDAINTLILSIAPHKIQNILISDIEHNSNFLPYFQYSQVNNKQVVTFPHKYLRNVDELEKYLTQFSPGFFFACTHCSNITGEVFDIEAIACVVHKYGGYIFVDDAQYISHNREFFKAYHIDFCAFSGHKIGAPTGIGVLIISKQVASLIQNSSRLGGGTIRKLDQNIPYYKRLPDFLEGGVQDFAGVLGLKYGLEQINTIGIETIHEYICELQMYFLQYLQQEKYHGLFTLLSVKKSPIITMIPNRFLAQDFHQYCNFFLENLCITFRTGAMCADMYVQQYLFTGNIMRISLGIYNTKQDIDIFFDILDNYLKVCKQKS